MRALDAAITVLDFETTGDVDGIPSEAWQLGMVKLQGGRLDERMQYSTLLRVGARPFNPHAPGRHRLLREEMACAPRLHDLWPEVHPWLIGCPLAAHNAATERKMLQQAAPLHRFGPWIDSLKLVRVAYPELPSHRMEDVLEILNLMDRVRECCPDREPHDALFDAAGCAALLEHLLHLPGWEQLTVEALTRARPRTFRRHVRARKRRK